MLNISEQRSKFAFEQVNGRLRRLAKGADAADEFATFVKKLPTLLAVNGVLKTVPFLMKTTESPAHWAYQCLDQWMTGPQVTFHWPDGVACRLAERLQVLDNSRDLREVNRECIELAGWLKHWSQALAPGRPKRKGAAGHGDKG